MPDLNYKSQDLQRNLAIALKKKLAYQLVEAFDAVNPKSRPNKSQQDILNDILEVQFRYVVAANQAGKTALGCREISWIFEENHPWWVRPDRWGKEPLLLIIAARTTKQLEENIWRKIQGFLDPSSYHVQRVAGILQKVTHVKNGNTIIFLSHHNESEAWEKLQGFVAHYAWVDEMPGSVKILEELHRRIQSRQGYFLATFTPKVRNDEIRKLVEACKAPYSKKYNLMMFDNPVLTDKDKRAIIDSLSSYPESYRRTVLYGDWSAGESAVFDFNGTLNVQAPTNYGRSWRHVLSVDPAMSGKAGVTLWAEDPGSGVWYCINSDYVEGCQAPDDLVNAIEAKFKGYNIVRRVSDPHETWYIGAASKLGFSYMGVFNKAQRKNELIKAFQANLTEGKIKIAPWCQNLIDELIECHWSETADGKIVNSSKFHEIDSSQYFVDVKPKNDYVRPTMSFDQSIRQADRSRLTKEAAKLTIIKNGIQRKHRKQWRIGFK